MRSNFPTKIFVDPERWSGRRVANLAISVAVGAVVWRLLPPILQGAALAGWITYTATALEMNDFGILRGLNLLLQEHDKALERLGAELDELQAEARRNGLA